MTGRRSAVSSTGIRQYQRFWPRRLETPRSNSAMLLGLLSLGQFMVALDVTVVNVALPSIDQSLGFSAGEIQWVVGSYVLVTGAFLLIGGRLSDMFGARRLLLIGLVGFTLASLGSGLSNSVPALITFRCLQGASAALFAPSALSVIVRSFVGQARIRALTLWGAIASGGAAIGLLIGGALTTALSWRWVFFINVPVGIICLIGLLVALPHDGRPRRDVSLDAHGGVLAGASVCLILIGTGAAGTDGWRSPSTLLPLGAGAALAIIFVLTRKRSRSPLVPDDLWRDRALTVSTLGMFAATMVLAGTLLLATFLIQVVMAASAFDTGLALLPTVAALAFASHADARLLGRFGARWMTFAGLLFAATGAVLLAIVPDDPSFAGDVLPGLLLLGWGLGLTFPALSTTSMVNVPAVNTGSASGLFMTAHDLGGAFGVVMISTVAVGAGSLSTLSGLRQGFVADAVIAAVAAVGCLALMPGYRPRPSEVARSSHGMTIRIDPTEIDQEDR
jgi:EmrB/QacA subfamily drug resistance transporter